MGQNLAELIFENDGFACDLRIFYLSRFGAKMSARHPMLKILRREHALRISYDLQYELRFLKTGVSTVTFQYFIRKKILCRERALRIPYDLQYELRLLLRAFPTP